MKGKIKAQKITNVSSIIPNKGMQVMVKMLVGGWSIGKITEQDGNLVTIESEDGTITKGGIGSYPMELCALVMEHEEDRTLTLYNLKDSQWDTAMANKLIEAPVEVDFTIVEQNGRRFAHMTGLIELSVDELKTFMADVAGGIGSWSDTSHRILRFIGEDPSKGL